MFTVPRIALPHLIRAVKQELANLEKVSNEVGDDWPVDFDVNDIGVYKIILDNLIQLETKDLDLGDGKLNWFITMILPRYVVTNRRTLSEEEYTAIKSVYAQYPWGDAPFPEL